MIILEGQKDYYVPVQSVSEGTTRLYICENQRKERFMGRIYRDLQGINPVVRRFLYATGSECFVELIDHGVVDFKGQKCAFEIYEYMEEGTLAQQSPMDEVKVRELVIPQLNAALHVLHSAGFLHRDIKPDNLYLKTGKDGREQVKIGDFETVAAKDKNGNYCDSSLAFTPGYVPAEVLGSGTYSEKSDYYGMAVTLYYLLTGKQIFDGMTPDEIMISTRRGELFDLSLVPKRMALLLEGLLIQDARYRWGYKEIEEWQNGANVPVFRYTLEEQVLNPPYRLTADVVCKSLKELGEALMADPIEGEKHLYGGLISDSLRRQYQHMSVALSDLTLKKFPHTHHAGMTAAIHLLSPGLEGFFWIDKVYGGLFELLDMVQKELSEHMLSSSTEELLSSGILPWYYEGRISQEDHTLLCMAQKEAKEDLKAAAAHLLLGIKPLAQYAPDKNTLVTGVSEYVKYLDVFGGNLKEQLLRDFNSTYFRSFLDQIGFGNALREWLRFFYKGDRVIEDAHVIGNVCQFLEKICPDEQGILRHFVLEEIYSSPEYWIRNHLDLYEMDEMMNRMVRENFESAECTEDMPVSELMRFHHEMKAFMDELRRDFLNNPWLYSCGTYDTAGYRITSPDTNAYFVPNESMEFVPIGWLLEFGTLRERNLVNQGLDNLKKEAAAYLENLSDHVKGFANDQTFECEKRKKERKIPGIANGVAAILISLLVLFVVKKLSAVYVAQSSMLLRGAFVAAFFADMLLLFAGLRRLILAVWYGRIQDSVKKLKEESDMIRALSIEVNVKQIGADEKLVKGHRNLESEAQQKRAFGGFLLEYRKLKNGVSRYYIILLSAILLMTAGMYLDGNLEFTKASFEKNVAIVLAKNEKKDKGSKENEEGNENSEKVYVVTVSNARLRKGPGTDYEILNGYDKGTEVTLTGESQSDGSDLWYQVRTPDGTVGWMRSDMIKEKE